MPVQERNDEMLSLLETRFVSRPGPGRPGVTGIEDGLLWFVLADKDGDGDFDPLISTDWDGDTKSGNGTIDWNAVFGVPSYAKAVQLYVGVSDAIVGTALSLKAKSTTTNDSHTARVIVANQYTEAAPVIPVASDGTSYYAFSAAMDIVFIRVIGWYI